MSERPKVPPQIVHDSDVLAEAGNAIDGINKLSLCVEWLMRETLLHLAAHEKRPLQTQNKSCQHEWEWAGSGKFKTCLKCHIIEYKDGLQLVWCICADPEVEDHVCQKCGRRIKQLPFRSEPQEPAENNISLLDLFQGCLSWEQPVKLTVEVFGHPDLAPPVKVTVKPGKIMLDKTTGEVDTSHIAQGISFDASIGNLIPKLAEAIDAIRNREAKGQE